MKTKRFRVPLVDVIVVVAVGDDFNKVRKVIEKHTDCEFSESVDRYAGFAITSFRRGGIGLRCNSSRRTVLHECYHLTQQILCELGCRSPDEEMSAILHEYVADKVLSLWESLKEV